MNPNSKALVLISDYKDIDDLDPIKNKNVQNFYLFVNLMWMVREKKIELENFQIIT